MSSLRLPGDPHLHQSLPAPLSCWCSPPSTFASTPLITVRCCCCCRVTPACWAYFIHLKRHLPRWTIFPSIFCLTLAVSHMRVIIAGGTVKGRGRSAVCAYVLTYTFHVTLPQLTFFLLPFVFTPLFRGCNTHFTYPHFLRGLPPSAVFAHAQRPPACPHGPTLVGVRHLRAPLHLQFQGQ